jgi:2-(1,2-epoxy-1,2-dihydrophenyl)acetyl-CoA isomerase
MAGSVLCEISDGVGTITLNRPDKGNAIGVDLAMEFAEAVDQLVKAQSVRAVLLTANGKAFCVGGDIGEMRDASDLSALVKVLIETLNPAIRTLAALPVPVVCALNGPFGGGGIGLALCADIVLAAESVKLRGGYSAIGLTPDLGSAWFLARRVGEVRTKEILLLNRPIGGAQCLEWGIVNQLVADARLPEEARECARRLAGAATQSLRGIKRLVDGAAHRTLAEHLALELDYMLVSARTEDGREGVAAFLEKRAPDFTGR